MVLAERGGRQLVSGEALLRYQVVCAVIAREIGGDLRTDAIHEVSAQAFVGPDGERRRPKNRTIYRWLRAYEEGDLAGLEPKARPRGRPSAVVPTPLVDFIAAQKKADVRASLPELVRRAVEAGLIASQTTVAMSSLHRVCVSLGIPTARSRHAKGRDSRRFAYANRMVMLLSDGKHFCAGVGRLRRVALFFLDDCTRKGLYVVVGTAESAELFLQGLFGVLLRHGMVDIVFLDQGPGFTADDTVAVLARLGIRLVHGEVGYPQGRGKIERFNQTVQEAVLRHLDGRADVNPDCGALQLRLQHWLEHTYNHTVHESLDGCTPSQRFDADPRPLRLASSEQDLRRSFLVEDSRLVSKDHVVSFEGVTYETPRGLSGQTVKVFWHVLDHTLHVIDPQNSGHLLRLAKVDVAANAKSRRGRTIEENLNAASDAQPVPQSSAADMAFSRDFAPMVGADGGFADQAKASAPSRDNGRAKGACRPGRPAAKRRQP